MVTHEVVPNGDVQTEWNVTPAGDHYAVIDEDKGSPDYDRIYTITYDVTDEFTMTSATITNNIVSVEVFAWGSFDSSKDIHVDIWDGNSWHSGNLYGDGTWKWMSDSWSELDMDQTDVNNFKVRFSHYAGNGWANIGCVYAVLTEGEPTGWSGGDVNAVANANIAEINGVPIEDIDEINGV